MTSQSLLKIAEEAKRAATKLRLCSPEQRREALFSIADALKQQKKAILAANALDLQTPGLTEAFKDRLSLVKSFDSMVSDIYKVAALPDPIGEILEERVVDNGLKLQKKRVAIGVIGVIYESRPNVTVDVAALALKSGNCVILRGGKETLRTNRALLAAIQKGLQNSAVCPQTVQLIKSPSRSQVKQLVKLDQYIDLIIPRGGEKLQSFCKKESTIPVIEGGIGICHLFVDETADLAKAVEVVVNAKTQRPAVCNALDTLLVHEKIAPRFLPMVVEALNNKSVSFRLDERAQPLLTGTKINYAAASQQDWHTEWLSLILGIKVVDNLQEAMEHIQNYSTRHSDGILTNTYSNAQLFTEAIDSAAVYVNASTRFTDGGQFGLGAEAAVSTQKVHARGPMGLKELTTYKWIVSGDYHVRD